MYIICSAFLKHIKIIVSKNYVEMYIFLLLQKKNKFIIETLMHY